MTGITAQATVFESLKASPAISEVLAQMNTQVSDVLEQVEKKSPTVFFAKPEIGPVSPPKPGEFGKKK